MSNLELKNFIALHRTVIKMDRILSRIFDSYGLTTGQFAVLEALYHKGDLTIGQVQEKILSTSGTMPLIVKNLEGRKLLEKFSDPNDGRRCILHITEDGMCLMQKVFPVVEDKIVEMFGHLSTEKKDELLGILKLFREEL
ncbi:MarR family transcriptional regulator, 2-MHQ and catechol-resistance regulon repressor [Peptoniphilus asaccharolyticus DSM 20463]|uniref:MarR family transcriptional regulator, 2-MHQ and catechol-resistance regulon repressor n=1 Tax=Peptoniphilus asaccharolyticus DSM 20463 TaxID=573058 RepID=A0A1W1VJ57_PEPAS|nr:MarR family transcriptional regulator [Peptoniphilus asaccharolyticus]MBL7574324.1 MarR family transcriptional regulator [Peptoniphilus asaccharolyticus]SMB92964.1 MarR family transcriptional regulator, 2-MHQ and catechol-resistance regulon repressor [Peptoniphilus asaccharolyticus DSM 20463]